CRSIAPIEAPDCSATPLAGRCTGLRFRLIPPSGVGTEVEILLPQFFLLPLAQQRVRGVPSGVDRTPSPATVGGCSTSRYLPDGVAAAGARSPLRVSLPLQINALR